MRANELVKKFGWEKAKVLLSAQGLSIPVLKAIYKTEDLDWMQRAVVEGDLMNVGDLKLLVASHELVESYGGLEKAKGRTFLSMHISVQSLKDLKQAILDVESCL